MEHIIALGNNSTELEKYLDSLDNVATILYMQLKKFSGDIKVLSFLRLIINSSPLNTIKGIGRREAIFDAVLNWLCFKGDDVSNTTDRMASDLVNLMMNEIDNFQDTGLIRGLEKILDVLKKRQLVHSKLFQFLPKLISLIGCLPSVTTSEDTQTEPMEGKEYVDFVITCISNIEWNPSITVTLASMFGDMILTEKQSDFVINKLVHQLEVIDLNEIPPLIYQLLLLSRKGNKRLILESISNYFNHLDENIGKENFQESSNVINLQMTFSQLAHMEGTVILHIIFAVKQDQNLGSEFIKYVKSNNTAYISPFTLSCLLSMARIHRFQDIIMDFLRTSIFTIFKDTERLAKASWIAEYPAIEPIPIEKIFHQVIKKTAYGWDQVIQSLEQLGVIVVNSTGSIRSRESARFDKSIAKESEDMLITARAWDLGVEILLELFKAHEMVRKIILDRIINGIGCPSTNILYFFKLLRLIAEQTPQILISHLPRVREILDHLSYLPVSIAEEFLGAVQPMIRMNPTFRDALILVLQKGLYAREVECRQVAISGIISLLKVISVKNDMTLLGHVPSEFGSEQNGGCDNEILFLEILGMSRRCLNQQPEIRSALYRGLIGIMEIQPSVSGPIFEILYPQFREYYESNTGVETPLHLHKCIEKDSTFKLAEPLYILLACLCKSVTMNVKDIEHGEYMEVESSQLTECQDNLTSLINRLCKADVIDFGLDKSADYNMATDTGSRNNLFAVLLLGCYEVMIEYSFNDGDPIINSVEVILKLFHKSKKLFDVLKDKSVNEKGRKSVVSIADNSALSFGCIERLCKYILYTEKQMCDTKVSLGSDIEFVKYIMAVAHNRLTSIVKKPEQDSEAVYRYCSSLAKIFLNVLFNTKEGKFFSDSTGKWRPIISVVINCYYLVIQIITKRWPERFRRFLVDVLDDTLNTQDTNLNKLLSKHLGIFQDLVNDFLINRHSWTEESSILLQIIHLLSKQFSRSSIDFARYWDSLFVWTDDRCHELTIQTPVLIRPIVSLLIQLSRNSSRFEAIHNLAKDVRAVIGDIGFLKGEEEEAEEDLTMTLHYSFDEVKSAYIIVDELLIFLGSSFEEIEWCLNKIKSSALPLETHPLRKDLEKRHIKFESHIYQRLIDYMAIMIELERSNIEGLWAEHLLKTLPKCYKALIAMVKYKLDEPLRVNKNFTNVIAIAGGDLTAWMYTFLTTYSQRKSEFGEETARKSKNGKKKSTSNPRTKAKISREFKIIPNLIFTVEMFERFLIKLAKKSKVNLTQYLKRSTARDFRINVRHMPEQSKSDDETSDPKNGDDYMDVEEEEEIDELVDEESQEQEEREEVEEQLERRKKRMRC